MVEPFGQYLKADTVLSPLDVAERFTQGVSPLVALQVDGPAPRLDQVVDR